MTQERARRLAAVWFADVVGYTELSARDEDLALRVVRELQRLTRVQCDARGGRIVKLSGDGILTVFESADGAVRAAVNVRDGFRQSLEARSADVSLRIGIHIGDVTESLDGDVYGDAVNAASRIEGVAEPGQVLMSEVAYRLLQQRTSIEAEAAGEFELKGLGPTRLFLAKAVEEAATEALHDLLQDELAPLQILSMEGMGGMGAIYLARDPGLRRTLAVKVLRTELVADKQARARFIREAQVIAGLSHPNVVGIHSVGELKDGTPYFVMDYIEGGSLQTRLEAEGPLPVPVARRMLGEVASALAAAHRRGVTHRDIKASNVLFDAESGRCLVSDWGIAALDNTVEMSPESRLTSTGAVIGSPKYMSPEQLAGDEVGPESDVYSLGLLAFELLVGEGPFPGETPRALMVAHLREEPPELSTLRGDVDPELSSLVTQCLAKSPSDRPSADRVAARLAPGSAHSLEWPPPGLDSLLGKGRTVGTWALVGMALVSLPVLAALLYPLPDLAEYEPASLLGVWFAVLVVAVVGVVLVAYAVGVCIETVLRWQHGLDLGYGWATLADVVSDHRGDTGTLITGGKEYVSLPDRERHRLRLLRIVGTSASLLAAAALVVTQMAGLVFFRIEDIGTSVLVTVFYGPAALLVLAGAAVEAQELNKVGRARRAAKKHRLPSESAGRLVRPWYESLEESSEGMSVGPGPQGRRGLAWAAGAAVVLLLFAGVVATLPVGMISVIGPLLGRNAGLRPSITQARVQDLQVGRPYRLPADPTLDAAAAAALLQQLFSARSLPGDSVWEHRSSAVVIAGSPLVAEGPMGSCPADAVECARDMIQPDSALAVASRGLTDAEHRYLLQLGHNPAFPIFSALAAAPTLDEFRAVEIDRGPPLIRDDMTWFDVPIPGYSSIRVVAYQKVGYAAALYAEGDVAGAERTLQELVSLGLLTTDDSSTLILGLIGAVVGNMGVSNLRVLYTLTGRLEDAAALQPAQAIELDDDLAVQAPERAASVEVVLQDPSVLRQLKYELVMALLYRESCTTPRGLLVGVRPAVAGFLDGPLRQELVRYPIEGQIYDLMLEWESRMSRRPPEHGWGTGIDRALSLAFWSARATGNRRLAACINLGGALY